MALELQERKRWDMYPDMPFTEQFLSKIVGNKRELSLSELAGLIPTGDAVHPEYRSRLVAQKRKGDARTDMFAATPPLEALELLFSMAVTEGIGYQRGDRERGMKTAFTDIRRAFFHADARRAVFAELPPEDAEPGMCGQLLKSTYGA